MKCTFAIRQMAYESVPDSLDEYLQMGATTTRKCLQMFCKAIMELYGEEFLRKPTYTDLEKLYAHHEEKHEFLGMLGSIDCTEEQHRDDDLVRAHQESMEVTREIINRSTHPSLKADLVEHIWDNENQH
ncbi:hypothetical protein Tco_1168084 [Tanacetum coccineum]